MSHVQKRSGRGWVARYRTPDGKERSKSFRRKIDGDRFLAQIEVDKSRGDWVDPRLGRITLGEWTEEYLSTITNLRASTRVRDESYIRNHVIPKFGTTPLSSIEHMAIRSWVAELAETKAPSTVHKAHQLLSKILRTAMDAGLLARNPAERVPLPKIERIEMQFLTPSEIWTLADAMDNRYRALVFTAAYTGLRIHDLRRTAVALWIAVDANPVDIARRAGHSSVSVVIDRYGHLMPGTQDKVTDALDTLANESNLTRAATAGC